MKEIEFSAKIATDITIEKKIKNAVNEEIDIKINNLFKNNSFFKLKSNNSLKRSQNLIIICLNSFLKVIDPQVFLTSLVLSTILFCNTNQSHTQ